MAKNEMNISIKIDEFGNLIIEKIENNKAIPVVILNHDEIMPIMNIICRMNDEDLNAIYNYKEIRKINKINFNMTIKKSEFKN